MKEKEWVRFPYRPQKLFRTTESSVAAETDIGSNPIAIFIQGIRVVRSIALGLEPRVRQFKSGIPYFLVFWSNGEDAPIFGGKCWFESSRHHFYSGIYMYICFMSKYYAYNPCDSLKDQLVDEGLEYDSENEIATDTDGKVYDVEYHSFENYDDIRFLELKEK